VDVEAAAVLGQAGDLQSDRSIARTGSSPFGQTSAQFMMVRQRNSR
jgi:hypothetical protein